MSALFLFLNSFIGLALGSAIVGLLNDRLFVGPAGASSSVAVVGACASGLAIVLLALGSRPYTRALPA